MFFFAPEGLVLVIAVNFFEQLPLRQGDGIIELALVFDSILKEFLLKFAGFFVGLLRLFNHYIVGRLWCVGTGIVARRNPTTN
jgi:hypothetical protein